MALSASDKREIAAMFQAFSDMERPPLTLEDMLMRRLIAEASPRLKSGAQAFSEAPVRGIQRPEDLILAEVLETAIIPTKRKKRMSQFNAAVKQGMSMVRASTSYGKKGAINNPKKAFTAVTKTVSKAKKGKATPKKGILKKVATAARKRFKGLRGRLA